MLYIDRKGLVVKTDGEALAFYENGTRAGTVPLAPLDGVVIRGDTCLHTSVLSKLGERGVTVTVLGGRKAEPTLLYAAPHKNAQRRLGQYQIASDPCQCLVVAVGFVRDKLQAQEYHLNERAERYPGHRHELLTSARQIDNALLEIDDCKSIPELRGLEGSAAARYFQALAASVPGSLGFTRRNRRPPKDPLNALLSLTYTLLYSDCARMLYQIGLDPYIGFYHTPEYGRKSLACDFLEPLRPSADMWALSLLSEKKLRVENFTIGEQGCLMNKEARSVFYPEYETFAMGMRECIEERARTLAKFVDSVGQNEGEDHA